MCLVNCTFRFWALFSIIPWCGILLLWKSPNKERKESKQKISWVTESPWLPKPQQTLRPALTQQLISGDFPGLQSTPQLWNQWNSPGKKTQREQMWQTRWGIDTCRVWERNGPWRSVNYPTKILSQEMGKKMHFNSSSIISCFSSQFLVVSLFVCLHRYFL